MKIKNLIFYLVIASLSGTASYADGQTPQQGNSFSVRDSSSLPQILKQVLLSYPTVEKAMEAIQVAEGGIGLAKSGYYPNITASAGYTRIGPVPELDHTQPGTFRHGPER